MEETKVVNGERLDRLTSRALGNPRRRANDNIHPRLEDPVQRLLNAIEPGSYIRPHRHTEPPKWELFILLQGSAAVLMFDASGQVRERVVLSSGSRDLAVEIPAGAWHTVAALETGTVVLEIKPGPYSPLKDKEFAAWAPEHDDGEMEAWLRSAAPGDLPPSPDQGEIRPSVPGSPD